MMSDTLYERYLAEQAKQALRPQQAAEKLGVSEGELLSVLPESQYLGTPTDEFLMQLESLGEVRSIVRNDLAVSEKTGVYRNLDLSPMMGTAINLGGLDLRLFLRRWKHLFAVKQEKLTSFQIFDAYGDVIQKIYLTDERQKERFHQICQPLVQSKQPEFETRPEPGNADLKTLNAEEIEAYQTQWQGLQNVHHFRVVLAEFGIDRLQGLQYAPQGDAQRLDLAAVEAVIRRCAERNITLLSFVNNSGMVQIQTGKVHNVSRMAGFLNILDNDETQFDLHLKDQDMAAFWLVRRPGSNGIVHSFEAYNRRRELVLQWFGRQADEPSEPHEWRELVQGILADFGVPESQQL